MKNELTQQELAQQEGYIVCFSCDEDGYVFCIRQPEIKYHFVSIRIGQPRPCTATQTVVYLIELSNGIKGYLVIPFPENNDY